MKEHPALMNGPMVRATITGDKTATRRTRGLEFFSKNDPDNWRCVRVAGDQACFVYGNSPVERTARCPYGQPGDHLWIRETWSTDFAAHYPFDQVWYAADNDRQHEIERRDRVRGIFSPESNIHVPFRWRPNIHMPRRHCRIILEVVDVRVERLQDGDGETAWESRYLAEGILQIDHGRGEHYYSAFHREPHPKNWADPFDAWRELWVSTGGNWAGNPWVWVVKFRRIKP